MALQSVEIPENRWIASVTKIPDAELRNPLGDLGIALTRARDSRQISFNIGHKDRHPDSTEVLRNDPQRDSLSGARRAGDETVTIGHSREQEVIVGSFGNRQPVRH
jgi:hypothetical protein